MTINCKTQSTRLRKLSPKKLVRVYKGAQLLAVERQEDTGQRVVSPAETGLQKEEETEHDLQAVLSASGSIDATSNAFIPVPNATIMIDANEYLKLYKINYKAPATNIRFSSTVEEATGCPYTIDEVDDAFMKDNYPALSLSENAFEKLVWECESIMNQQLPLHSGAPHIPEYEDFLLLVPPKSVINSSSMARLVYEHWKERRNKRGGQSVIPVLAKGTRLDPYVCFRRHDTKSIRKTRYNSKLSLDRLHSLRSNMETARHLLKKVTQREMIYQERMLLEHQVFNVTCKGFTYQRILGIDEDMEHIAPCPGTGTTIKIPASPLDKLYVEKELQLKHEQDALYENITEYSNQPFAQHLPKKNFQQLSSSSPNQPKNEHLPRTAFDSQLVYRKRLGRSGRLFLDRKKIKFIQPPESPTPIVNELDTKELGWDYDSTSETESNDQSHQNLDTMTLTLPIKPVNATIPMEQHQKHKHHRHQHKRTGLQRKDVNKVLALRKTTDTIQTRSGLVTLYQRGGNESISH